MGTHLLQMKIFQPQSAFTVALLLHDNNGSFQIVYWYSFKIRNDGDHLCGVHAVSWYINFEGF